MTDKEQTIYMSDLPHEILLKVFSFLDVPSLRHASLGSKLWNELADDDLLWKALCAERWTFKWNAPLQPHPLVNYSNVEFELQDSEISNILRRRGYTGETDTTSITHRALRDTLPDHAPHQQPRWKSKWKASYFIAERDSIRSGITERELIAIDWSFELRSLVPAGGLQRTPSSLTSYTFLLLLRPRIRLVYGSVEQKPTYLADKLFESTITTTSSIFQSTSYFCGQRYQPYLAQSRPSSIIQTRCSTQFKLPPQLPLPVAPRFEGDGSDIELEGPPESKIIGRRTIEAQRHDISLSWPVGSEADEDVELLADDEIFHNHLTAKERSNLVNYRPEGRIPSESYPIPHSPIALPSMIQLVAILAHRIFAPAVANPGYNPFIQNTVLTEKLQQACAAVSVEHLGPLHQKLTSEYYTILEHGEYTLCIFALEKGESMPVHDHPSMCVFSRVVEGVLHVKTYEWVDGESRDHHSPKRRLAKIGINEDIPSDCDKSLLVIKPGVGSNLHSFTAASDRVVVLDLLGPPYTEPDGDRPCTHYREASFAEGSALSLQDDRIQQTSRNGYSNSSRDSTEEAAVTISSVSSQKKKRKKKKKRTTAKELYQQQDESSSITSDSINDWRDEVYSSTAVASASAFAAPSDDGSRDTIIENTPDVGDIVWLVEAPDLDYPCDVREYQGAEVTPELLSSTDVWSLEQLLVVTDAILRTSK
ncbi:hypothetical protein SmJEL517_g02484 [Synchytrium microbalum]|uniref:F-box domain-containing protein n=1 Tax=Synchytrium microbalum TaxID=1806994 RepID=A0A507C6U6_9FUNG|nr:uncharacterized protein SmJEL517_g02484 [Synchytrium microbalum]TPX35068.1 hypothetical protein SmJEL517_g02484 [Synchytrium microbalum]